MHVNGINICTDIYYTAVFLCNVKGFDDPVLVLQLHGLRLTPHSGLLTSRHTLQYLGSHWQRHLLYVSHELTVSPVRAEDVPTFYQGTTTLSSYDLHTSYILLSY